MRYIELENIEPEVGDIVGLELGGTLIETVITEIRSDGVVISLDENAVNIMIEANRAKHLSERRVAEAIPSYKDTDSFTDYSYGQQAKNNTDDTSFDPQPASSSNAEPIDQTGCNNAITWGRKALRNLDTTLRRELASHGEQAVIEYLKIVAREENAYLKSNFTNKDLINCQDSIATVLGKPNIKNWIDVLQSLIRNDVNEAEYQGRKVALGKPMAGDVKKSKVYVKGPKGNVVKVNFGDPDMKIKKSNPARRKSFRARHNCENPGPRWKARYWSCRAW